MSEVPFQSPTSEYVASDPNGDIQAGGSVPDTKASNDPPNQSIVFTEPAAPLDDRTFFTQLLALAQNAGRMDLVDEFRRRADASGPPQPSPNGTVAKEGPKPRPTVSTSLVDEGLRLIRELRLPEAVAKLREATKREGDKHGAFGNMGVALARLGKVAEAEAAFREAVRIRPDAAAMQANLGMACLQQKKYTEAEEAFREALRVEPNNSDFHRHLGSVLESANKLEDAAVAFRAAVTTKPSNPECHFCLGKALQKTNKPTEAEKCFREATRLRPDQANYWASLGGCLESQGQSPAAEAAYRVAVGLDPKNAENHNNLGVCLANQYRAVEAEAAYRKAIELAPKMAMAHNNLGNCLRTQGKLDEAIASLQEAIRLAPRYAEAHNNLGIVYIQKRQTSEGAACYEEALKIKADYPEAHLNRSLLWLGAGDYERGWNEYEWRFRLKGRKVPGDTPRWDGKPLDGRRLLLHCEQGLGDAVQFMRYAVLVSRGTGGHVGIECPEPLVELARTCPGIDQVITRGQALKDFDISTPLLSLPGLVGTNLTNIPGNVPYLTPSPERVAHWRAELDLIPGRKIGIAWQGSRDHKGDKLRSMSLAAFAPLAKARGVSLCSIQKSFGTEQLTDGTVEGLPVRDFGSLTTTSFADTAALIQALDLVVTVDTAIAHVAGAVGAPVWVMLPYAADWRWLTERSDTPWYPTMRLYRQTKLGDWTDVFARVVAAIEQWPDRLRGAVRQ